jgi:NitT/TauT family transport system ATP-binding protein
VAGLLAPARGSARCGGETWLDTERRVNVRPEQRRCGYVFQDYALFPHLSAWRNVGYALPPERRRERALELLERFGIDAGRAEARPRELSGGIAQRVAITRALVHNPAMLLMDEPFGALDAMTRDSLNLELQRIWLERRETIVFITHSIAEAVFLADRVFVMTPRPGHIAEEVAVPIARPRSLDLAAAPQFGDIVRRIRAHFRSISGVDT